MKKTIFFIFLFSILLSCSSKVIITDLESDMKSYISYLSEGKYTKAVEFMPDDFWIAYEKNQFISDLNEVSKQTGNISIQNMKIEKIGKSIEVSGQLFKVISYSCNLLFDSDNLNDIQIITLKENYGSDNVQLDTLKHKVQIDNIKKELIAVFDKKKSKWKYLEKNEKIIYKVYGAKTWQELK